MNGVGYSRFQIGSKDWDARVAKSKFASMPGFGKAAKGHICLQDHGDLVSYRNIKIRRLPADGKVADPVTGALPVTVEKAFPALEWANWKSETDEGKNIPFRPIVLTHPGDGSNRVFVASQHGVVYEFANDQAAKTSKVLLDIQDRCFYTDKQNEEGFLGMAVHPKFKENGKLYVYYTHKRSRCCRWSPNSRSVPMEREGTRADGDPPAVLEPQRRHALLRQGRDAVYRSG